MLTHLVVEAKFPKLAEQRKQQLRSVKQQPTRVLGGTTGARRVDSTPTFVEWFEKSRNGQPVSLDN